MNSEQINTQTPAWLRLCAYGDFQHSRGLQRFDSSAARAIVSHYKSLRGRLSRGFGGLPIYVGHPDDPEYTGRSGHSDTRAHGWIQDMDARPDGLYIKVKWASTGQDLLHNAHYKFLSPRWALKDIGHGAYRPCRLLSVGLTNHPNIPGHAIANETSEVTSPPSPSDISTVSEESATTPKAADTPQLQITNIQSQIDCAPSDSEQSELETRNSTYAADLSAAQADADRFYRLTLDNDDARRQAQQEADHALTAFANERNARIDLILNDAIQRQRITIAEWSAWHQRLNDDFDTALADLDQQECVLPNECLTANLRLDPHARSQSLNLIECVNTRMADHNETFAQAWTNLKQTRPDLFLK